MKKQIGIGIIGTGVGIRTHLKGFRSVPNCEVKAIAGSTESRAREFAAQYNIPKACADYKELCDMDDIDLICVCPPNKFHYDTLKYALSTGKNIICEKPVSHITKEVEELEKLAKYSSAFICVDHQLRFNPYMSKIKDIIQNNVLGNIYSVRINQLGIGFSDLNLPWSWSFDGAEGGGVRLAMASHFNDLIQFWFNDREILSVAGYLNPVFKSRIIDNEERTVTGSTICNAFITFKDELSVIYSINAGGYSAFKFEIDIYGDKGELHFDLVNKISIYTIDKKCIPQNVEVEGVFDDERENKASLFSGSFRYFAPLVIRKLLGEDVPELDKVATLTDALYNCKILDGIRESANSGKLVSYGFEENNYV